MTSLLAQLLELSPESDLGDADYHQRATALVKLLQDPNSKLTGKLGADSLLDMLDPAANSIAYIYTLLAFSEAQSPKGLSRQSGLWSKMLNFVSDFDAVQIRYCGPQYKKLIESIIRGTSQDPVPAIEPIRTAILRLDPSGATLTSAHIFLLKLCLQTRAYGWGPGPVLDNDVYHLPSKENPHQPLPCAKHATSSTFISSAFSTKLTYQDYLLYFLYGAMLYIGVQDWDRAITYLEIVLAAPGSAVSMIQVEAYKKWVLVCLIRHGKPRNLARLANSGVAKIFHALGKAYDVLAEAFKDADPAKLRAEIQAGPFASDLNQSLASLIFSAHQKFRIIALSKTYASIPLSTIVQMTSAANQSPEDAEAYIKHLVSTSQLPGATIHNSLTSDGSSAGPFLRFRHPEELEYAEKKLHTDIVMQRSQVISLGSRMKDTERKIELTKEFVEATKKARKSEAEQDAGVRRSGSPGGTVDDDVLADI